MILETERLILREMGESDLPALSGILMDGDVMYAYEGAFTREETRAWLDRQIARYRDDGYGLWAVILKDSGEMIGQCGLTNQNWRDETRLEVGYLFNKSAWHKGYCTEAARGCLDYAFTRLQAKDVCSIIRDTNAASRAVAVRNGLTLRDEWVKHYRGVDMAHVLYVITREEWESRA